MDGNLYDWFRDNWDERLERVALAVPDSSLWTYRDLDERSAQLACALRRHGSIGDRVVVQVDKSPEAVALYLACLRAGLVYVPLNTAYTAPEVEYFVADAAPAVFIGRPDTQALVGVATLTLGTSGDGTLLDAALDESTEFESADRGPDDWVAMLYTSGTTGRSKGAMLSGRNLASNATALRSAWHWQPDDVLCHVLPIFHVHGLFVALHCALFDAGRIEFVLRFDVAVVRSLLPTSTVLMGVPTHYTRLLADPDFGPADCSAMRLFTSGSAPMTVSTHAEFTDRTGHEVVERYGMTEAMIMTSNPSDGARVPGTVGYAINGVEARVANADGEPVGPEETGVVETRGPNVFLGYWGLPDKTAETVRPDGWLITGDVGSMAHDGRITLVGRESDMIICGGLNVYPKEIETVLDAIAGVVESAVIGVPHPDFGEAVVAVLVVDAPVTHDDVAAAVDGRLARFKHPKATVIVDSLPRNAMGKIQKAQLRDAQAARFGAG